MIKKLFKLVIFLFILLMVALIAGYFVGQKYVNSPAMREKIITAVEQNTQRKATLGGLGLSLFPFSLQIENLSLKEKDEKTNFIALKKLDLKINLMALLSKQIDVPNIILDAPEINITQYQNGTFNFSDMLTAAKSSSPSSPSTPTTTTTTSPGQGLPIDFRIDLIKIASAKLNYTTVDINQKSKSIVIPNFDLSIENLSMTEKINLDLKIAIGEKSSVDFTVITGPLQELVTNPTSYTKLESIIKGKIEIGSFKDLELFLPSTQLEKLSSNQFLIEFDMAGSLAKQMTLNLKTDLGQDNTITLKTIISSLEKVIQDHNKASELDIDLSGLIDLQNIKALNSYMPQGQLEIVPVSGINITLSAQGNLAKGFDANLKIKTPGLSQQNQIHADLESLLKVNLQGRSLNEITLDTLNQIDCIFQGKINMLETEFAPNQKININCSAFDLNLKANTLKLQKLTLAHPSTTILFDMDVTGLNPSTGIIKINTNLSSERVVVHELLKALPKPVSPSQADPAQQTVSESSEKSPESEVDLHSIPYLNKIQLSANIDIKQIIYEKNTIQNFIAKISLMNGVLNLNPLQMDLFNGQAMTTGQVNLLSYPLEYKLNKTIKNINLNDALKVNLDQDDYYGILSSQVNISGKGITIPNLKKNLQANGKLEVTKGKIISQGGSFMDKLLIKLDNPLLLSAMPELKPKIEEAKKNASKPSETPFDDSVIEFNLNNGIAQLTKFLASSPDFKITASGTAQPFDDSIDIKTQINLSEAYTKALTSGKDMSDLLPYQNKGLYFPATINGKMSDPSVMPDMSILTKNLIQGQAKKQINKLLGDQTNKQDKDSTGGLLGGLLGGKQTSNLNQAQAGQKTTSSNPLSNLLGGGTQQTQSASPTNPTTQTSQSTSQNTEKSEEGGLGGIFGKTKKLGGIFQ